jgi:hypothetical protein
MTKLPRRRFLVASSAALLTLGRAAGVGAAAAAARSRTYVSDWKFRKIAAHLMLGTAYQLGKAIESGQIDFSSDKIKTTLDAFSKQIDVEIDDVQFRIAGDPQSKSPQDLVLDIASRVRRALQDDRQLERSTLDELAKKVLPDVEALVNHLAVDLSYRIRYKRVTLKKFVHFSHDHWRATALISQPVGRLNSLSYIVDAREHGGCTTITDTLGLNVCTGLREGPLIRRLAERVIGRKEDEVLCRIEQLVLGVIREDPNATAQLQQLIPELMHRAESQQF